MGNSIAIIATGTEITNGKSIDTNSGWLANELTQLGFTVQTIHAYPDNPDILKKGIYYLLNENKYQWILLTGGLGPTQDDYTVDVICEIFQCSTYKYEKALKKLESIYKSRGKNYEEILPIASRQTRVPEGGVVLENEVGIAPGFIIDYVKENLKVHLVCMPGVPQEMKTMFQNHLKKILIQSLERKYFYRDERWIWNIGESLFQESFIKDNPLIDSNIQWGVAAKKGYIKVYFLSSNASQIEKIIQSLEEKFKDIISTNVFQEVHNIMIKKNKKLAIAESCTGGLLAKLITDLAGSSNYFLGSLVTYSNQAKENLLFVPHTILEQNGAVSEPTAKEMLFGLEKHFDADYFISITGIAGPEGGTPQKPVGTVFIGIKRKNNKPKIIHFQFQGNREMIREASANNALFLLYKELQEE